MKKTSFVCAILASALLAGACGGKKAQPAAPTGGDMAPAGGSGSGSDMAPPAGGSGSGSGSSG